MPKAEETIEPDVFLVMCLKEVSAFEKVALVQKHK
jgi:hypothetical protein